MNDHDLKLVLAAFKRQHPDMTEHLRALARSSDPAVVAAATPVLQCMLEIFDAKEQAQWVMRDMLKKMPKLDGGHYYALKYGATILVQRLAIAGGMDLTGQPWTDAECEGDWKQENGHE